MDLKNASVVIVDDDLDFCDALAFFLEKVGITNIKTAHDFDNGKKLVETIQPDLVLLDVNLAHTSVNGIDLGVLIKLIYPNTHIIFFTNEYREEVFEKAKKIQPDAFLDKSLSELKVRQAVELALQTSLEDDDDVPPAAYAHNFVHDYIFVKIGGGFRKINLADIDYILYAERYSNLMIGEKSIPLSSTLRELIKSLPINDFIQIHKSHVVNIRKINQINIIQNYVEIGDKKLPIGIRYKKYIQDSLILIN